MNEENRRLYNKTKHLWDRLNQLTQEIDEWYEEDQERIEEVLGDFSTTGLSIVMGDLTTVQRDCWTRGLTFTDKE